MAEVLEAPEVIESPDKKTKEVYSNRIIVYNDDFNTFHHVIGVLIKYCKHTLEQAEQCTWIIHHNGKCCVKEGGFKKLNEIKKAICEEGIDAKVE